jgi:hypothetical protein
LASSSILESETRLNYAGGADDTGVFCVWNSSAIYALNNFYDKLKSVLN